MTQLLLFINYHSSGRRNAKGAALGTRQPLRVRYATSVNKLVLRLNTANLLTQTPICYSLIKTFIA